MEEIPSNIKVTFLRDVLASQMLKASKLPEQEAKVRIDRMSSIMVGMSLGIMACGVESDTARETVEFCHHLACKEFEG